MLAVHRRNNFDILRLTLAAFVIVTHAYPLSGAAECDWLCQVSDGQALLSKVGVKGFFILSGYLIYQSLIRSTGLLDFFWKRSLRLFPALFLVLLLTVILAPFVYAGEQSYLANRSVWTYIPNNMLLYRTQFGINGVFENNPYAVAINGSLWTIRYEFTMYIIIALLFPVKLHKLRARACLITLLALFYLANSIAFINELELYPLDKSLYELGIYFVSGAILANLEIEKLKYKNHLLLACVLIFALSLKFGFYNQVSYAVMPFIIILIGQGSVPIVRDTGKVLGDISYGLYIYGFPVQQALVYFFALDYLRLMSYGFVISAVLAYASWHLVEKRALKFKKFHPNALLYSLNSLYAANK